MRHVLVVLFVLGALFISVSVADAEAAVTVGSSLRERANLFTRCDSYCTEMQVTRPGGLPGATIPSDGVITRWRIRAATRGWVRLRILRPVGDGTFKAVAASDPVQLSNYHDPGQDSQYQFRAKIPVLAGDVLALDRDRSAGAVFHGYGADTSYSAATFSPALGDLAAAPSAPVPGRELLLNADVERDADGDGLGDETQDSCPSVPASTPDVPCPVTAPPPATTPVTPTPGYEGPTVPGEGGPTKPTGNDPVGHGTSPTVRPEPKAPRKRSKRHGAGKPTRPEPPNRSEEETRGHSGGKPTRGNPPAQTKQESQGHGGSAPERPEPPATAPDRPSGHGQSTTQRPEPAKPKAKRKRKHRGGKPQRNDPPPAPKQPGFAPHGA
jgi:hypothetical protein